MVISVDLNAVVEGYERDGVAIVRGVVRREWIDRIGSVVDKLTKSSRSAHVFSTEGRGRFIGENFLWLHEPEIKEFIYSSGLAELAGKIMRARQVQFFYDQMLVKEPGATKRTPWHQDLPYWPLRGEQILSMWLALDSATPENGVVTYVRGSHKWKKFFPIQPFADAGTDTPVVEIEPGDQIDYDRDGRSGEWGTLADVRNNPDNYEFLTWNVEPGDAILHHPLTVHAAPGNSSANMRRRALSVRWLGDDVRWDDSRPHFMRHLRGAEGFPYPVLNQGDPVVADLFPKIWTEADSI